MQHKLQRFQASSEQLILRKTTYLKEEAMIVLYLFRLTLSILLARLCGKKPGSPIRQSADVCPEVLQADFAYLHSLSIILLHNAFQQKQDFLGKSPVTYHTKHQQQRSLTAFTGPKQYLDTKVPATLSIQQIKAEQGPCDAGLHKKFSLYLSPFLSCSTAHLCELTCYVNLWSTFKCYHPPDCSCAIHYNHTRWEEWNM